MHLVYLRIMDYIKADSQFSSFDWSKYQHILQLHVCYYEVIYVHFQNSIDFGHVNVYLVGLVGIDHSISPLVIDLHTLCHFCCSLVGLGYHKYSEREVIQICLEDLIFVFYHAFNDMYQHLIQGNYYFSLISFFYLNAPYFDAIQ